MQSNQLKRNNWVKNNLKKVLLKNSEDVNTMNMIVICFKNNGLKKNVDKLMGTNYKIVKNGYK